MPYTGSAFRVGDHELSFTKGIQRPTALHCNTQRCSSMHARKLDSSVYPPSRENFMPWSHVTASLEKGRLSLVTLSLTHTANPLRTEKEKSASEENILWKLLSLNRKHFVMEKNLTCGPWNNLYFVLVTRLHFGEACAEWLTGKELLLLSWPFLYVIVYYSLNTPTNAVISAFDPSMGHTDHSGKRGVWR